MKNLIKKTLKESNERGVVLQENRKTVCRVCKKGYMLEGNCLDHEYSTKIVDKFGKVIDTTKVHTATSNDLKNAIKESLDFFNNIVDSFVSLNEAEDDEEDNVPQDNEEEITADAPPEEQPEQPPVEQPPTENVPTTEEEPVQEEVPENTYSLVGELENMANSITELGDMFKTIISGLPDDDAENKSIVVGFQATLYELSKDIKDFQEDLLTPED